MMIKMINIFCLILVTLFVSCGSPKSNDVQSGTVNNDNLYIVDLDILEEMDFTKINYSTIFNKVETIILETNKESLVGSRFEFYAFENYIFILNTQPNKDFLLFDRDGKFIRKIGGQGGGPGEYRWAYDFTIDPVNRVIYLLCNLFINKYTIDGNYIGTIRLEGNASFIQYADGKLYTEFRGNDYLLQEIDPETGKQTGKYLEREKYNKGWNASSFRFQGGPFRHRWSESPIFVDTFMDTIFKIRQGGLIPFLTIKSKHLTTNADIKATEGMASIDRIRSIQNKNKIFCIFNYFETKNHIYFFYTQGTTRVHPVLYCLSTNSYSNPFFFNDLVFGDNSIYSHGYMFSNPNGVYGTYYEFSHSQEMFLDLIKEGKLSPNVDKREELMKLTEESNPVFFYYSYD